MAVEAMLTVPLMKSVSALSVSIHVSNQVLVDPMPCVKLFRRMWSVLVPHDLQEFQLPFNDVLEIHPDVQTINVHPVIHARVACVIGNAVLIQNVPKEKDAWEGFVSKSATQIKTLLKEKFASIVFANQAVTKKRNLDQEKFAKAVIVFVDTVSSTLLMDARTSMNVKLPFSFFSNL